MYGYKGFDKDFKCRGFQYEVGKTYELEGELKICKNGFHFCIDPNDVIVYYPMVSFGTAEDPSIQNNNVVWVIEDPFTSGITAVETIRTANRYAIVEALGDIVTERHNSKYATNKIKIIKEIPETDYVALCRAFEREGTDCRL